MAKYREVPKSLVSFNSDDLSDDTELIPPELLFEDFLASPEVLFGKTALTKVKLKSPEELFGKAVKPGNNGKEPKNISIKKDKKPGK